MFYVYKCRFVVFARTCPEPDHSESNITRQYGSWYGLQLTLNVHGDDYVGMLAQSVGARIVVHNIDVQPTPDASPVFAAPGEARTELHFLIIST